MARERLSMRSTREILRQKWVLGMTHRDVAASLDIGIGTVTGILQRAEAAGLEWAGIEALSDDALEARICGPRIEAMVAKAMPDPVYLHTELHRTGVTLMLLHQEYLEEHPDGYRYSQYCEHYRRWKSRQKLSMRQVHRGGEKLFVDYSGKQPHIIDPGTGEVIWCELYVAAMGASNFTYAESTLTQRTPDFLKSHIGAFEYMGGVPGALVPDQLKTGVTDSNRYEPGIQRTYDEFSLHYGTCVIPARPARPRDKAKVEGAVLIAQRWILARLRNETFFSLAALNARIRELLDELNGRVMRTYGVSRRELFERLDKPMLKPLPAERFEYGAWKKAKVNIDYHVEVDHHAYSVPHGLVGEEVEAWISGATIALFHRSRRICVHMRSHARGQFTTIPEHMPAAHQKHLEWTPSRILNWAGTVGPGVRALAEAIMLERRHPEQGYRSCLGILRLGKRYGGERLEVACGRALAVGARTYRHVAAMLKNGMDRAPLLGEEDERTSAGGHEHVRGSEYYN